MAILSPSFQFLFRIGPWNTPVLTDGSTFSRQTSGEPGLFCDHFAMASQRHHSTGIGNNPLWRASEKDEKNDASNPLEGISIPISSDGPNKHSLISGGKTIAEIEVDRTGRVSLWVLAPDAVTVPTEDNVDPSPKHAVHLLELDQMFLILDTTYAVRILPKKVVLENLNAKIEEIVKDEPTEEKRAEFSEIYSHVILSERTADVSGLDPSAFSEVSVEYLLRLGMQHDPSKKGSG